MGDNSEFGIRPDYRHRLEPTYFDDETGDVRWQPDVYRAVNDIAAATGRGIVVDLGCGSGSKLGDLTGRRVVAADWGANLAEARSNHPGVEFHEIDLGVPFEVPLASHEFVDAVVMSSDVIEHLPDPVPFLEAVVRAVSLGAVVVLSTPEREVTWGADHLGPPPNAAHCREWTVAELRSWVAAGVADAGVASTVIAGLTRSTSASPMLGTILLAVVPDAVEPRLVAPFVDAAWPDGAAAALAEQRQALDALERRTAAELERVEQSWREEVDRCTAAWREEGDRRDAAWREEFDRSDTAWRQEVSRNQTAFEAELERQVSSWQREVEVRDEHIRDLKSWIEQLEQRLGGS
jgi:SAM-dependent methyltransferase